MDPHLIERLARERLRDRLRQAHVDGRLHAAGHRIVRRPLRIVSAIAALRRRRHDPCATPASCRA